MSKSNKKEEVKVYRIFNGDEATRTQVTAAQEVTRIMNNADRPGSVKYYCAGQDKTGKECGIEMKLSNIYGETTPHFYPASLSRTHIEDCCYSRKGSTRTIKIEDIDMNPDNFDRNEFFYHFAKKSKGTAGPGGYGGPGPNPGKEHEEDDFVKDMIEVRVKKKPNTLKTGYMFLAQSVIRPDTEFKDGSTAKESIINSRTIEAYRNGDINAEGHKIVVAQKTDNGKLFNQMMKGTEEPSWLLEDAFCSENKKEKIYYNLAFPVEIEEFRTHYYGMLNGFLDEDIMIIAGDWQKVDNNKYTIFTAKITDKKMIAKLKDEEIIENEDILDRR